MPLTNGVARYTRRIKTGEFSWDDASDEIYWTTDLYSDTPEALHERAGEIAKANVLHRLGLTKAVRHEPTAEEVAARAAHNADPETRHAVSGNLPTAFTDKDRMTADVLGVTPEPDLGTTGGGLPVAPDAEKAKRTRATKAEMAARRAAALQDDPTLTLPNDPLEDIGRADPTVGASAGATPSSPVSAPTPAASADPLAVATASVALSPAGATSSETGAVASDPTDFDPASLTALPPTITDAEVGSAITKKIRDAAGDRPDISTKVRELMGAYGITLGKNYKDIAPELRGSFLGRLASL